MNEKIDKTHPDFPVYLKRCEQLWMKYQKLIDKEEAKYPDWTPLSSFRNPADRAIRELLKRRTNELIALQTEYEYLFKKASDRIDND